MMTPLRSALAAAALPLTFLVAGCSGNARTGPAPLPITAAADSRGAERSTSSSFLYSCTSEPKCFVFDDGGQLVRKVPKGFLMPLGLAADPQGNLYMADEFAKSVTVWAPGMTNVLQTLPTGTDVPLDVAVHDGWIATSDLHAVTVFPSGSATPVRLTDADQLQGSGIAFDSHGNCYWSLYLDQASGHTVVDEFIGCAGDPQRLNIPGSPVSLAFDGNDNLYYASDSFDAKAGIYTCTGLTHCAAKYFKGRDPLSIRFDNGWQHLYAADGRGHTISRIDLSTGKVDQTIRKGFSGYLPPVGIAFGPGPQ
jgi:DNA-binding beta-propeller fold protein YncE